MKKLLLLGKILAYIFSIILLLTILCIFTLALIDLFVFKSDPSQIGPIGDTFGGLLSPVIGLISIYFIFKTFEAQREQLEDQKKVNKASISSVYLDELRDFLTEVKNQIDKLEFYEYDIYDNKITDKMVTGPLSLNEFLRYYNISRNKEMLGRFVQNYATQMLERINIVLHKMFLFNESLTESESDIEGKYARLIKSRFETTTTDFLSQSIEAYELVRLRLKKLASSDAKIEEHSHDNTIPVIKLYIEYVELMHKLIKQQGFININSTELNNKDLEYNQLYKNFKISNYTDKNLLSKFITEKFSNRSA